MLRRLDSGEYLDVHDGYNNPFKTLKISVGDVDADGIDEAVTVAGMVAGVGEDCQLHKQLYKNTVIEPFSPPTIQEWRIDEREGGCFDSRGVGVGDFDGDGLNEIVIGNFNSHSRIIRYNKSKDDFELVAQIQGVGTTSLEVADTDGDGIPEIIVGKSDAYPDQIISYNRATNIFTVDDIPTLKDRNTVAIALI